jgi:hypothetical protein
MQATNTRPWFSQSARRRGFAYLEQPGLTPVVEAPGSPLFRPGFDPLNVQVFRPGELLHTRWLRLGNQAGTVAVFGYVSLSEGVGECTRSPTHCAARPSQGTPAKNERVGPPVLLFC